MRPLSKIVKLLFRFFHHAVQLINKTIHCFLHQIMDSLYLGLYCCVRGRVAFLDGFSHSRIAQITEPVQAIVTL